MTATLEAPTAVVETRRFVPESLRPWRDPSPRVGWLVTLAVMVAGAITRFWAIGWPNEKIFDEVYYATEAQEILRYGYEDNRGYTFIVHPPLGKWLIGAGSWLAEAVSGSDADTNAIGWRLAPALAGLLSIYLITRTARRMFRSNLFAGIAGALLVMDGVTLVQSRVALLDIFLQTFVLAGFAALVVDRDQMRGRLARLLEEGADLSDRVPRLGPRPWRLLAGVMFGCACAVKWNALFFVGAFWLLSLAWDRGALRSAGVRRSWTWTAARSAPHSLAAIWLAGFVTYLFTWTGWFAGETSWNRHWGDTHGGRADLLLPLGLKIPFHWGWVPDPVRALFSMHLDAWRFHSNLNSGHPYDSNPWNWLILGRPVDYYYNGDSKACGAAQCAREVLLIGTPLMWWAFLPAVLWLVWHWATTRDWRAAAVLVAFVPGWGVWVWYAGERTMFLFYMTPLVPFLILGVTLALGVMLGPGIAHVRNAADWWHLERRRKWGIAGVATYLGLVIANFAWMWPIYTGGLLTYEQWNAHMWLRTWV